jgi:DNA-binding transcriptional ArsR family regulator
MQEGKSGRILLRPQQDYPAATVDQFCTAVDTIREIARLTGVSRNTVSKHLAANTIEPKLATPERQSKIDPFAEKLAGWLKTEAGKSRKERRIIKQLLAKLVALGFTGSYARLYCAQVSPSSTNFFR